MVSTIPCRQQRIYDGREDKNVFLWLARKRKVKMEEKVKSYEQHLRITNKLFLLPKYPLRHQETSCCLPPHGDLLMIFLLFRKGYQRLSERPICIVHRTQATKTFITALDHTMEHSFRFTQRAAPSYCSLYIPSIC